MAHESDERLSLALDGLLAVPERAALDAHLASCDECRARWDRFQQVDRLFSAAAAVAPAPGFASRVAARLARRQAQETARQRMFAGLGALVAGAAVLVGVAATVSAALWGVVSGLVQESPALLSSALAAVARLLVTLEALNLAGRSLVALLLGPGAEILVGYLLVVLLLAGAWIQVVRLALRGWRGTRSTLVAALAWF